jgi:DNA-directed RNA polymerase subunit L
MSFEINDIDVSVVNALRRTILSEIPNVCFMYDPYDPSESTVKIFDNTGSLHNEFIGHRLGLIPLCFDEDQVYKICKNEINFKFTLKKQNTSGEIIPVMTSDFILYELSGKVIDGDEREKILPKNSISGDYILITKLKPNLSDYNNGELINVHCVPKAGTALQHAAWCPVSLCVFHNKMDEKAAEKAFEGWMQKHRDLRKEDGRQPLTDHEEKEYHNRFFIMDAYRHFVKNSYGEPSSFNFDIESECGLSPIFLIFKGLHVLSQKVWRIFERLRTNDPNITINPHPADPSNMFEIQIEGEGHTLGNLMQSLMFNMYVRDRKELSYVGYYQSHPLEEHVSLKIKTVVEKNKDEVRKDMMRWSREIYRYLQNIIDEWLSFSKLSKNLLDVKEYIKEIGLANRIDISSNAQQEETIIDEELKPEEVSREAPEKPKEVSEDISRESPEKPKEVSEDISRESPEKPKEVIGDVSQEAPEKHEEISNEVSQETPEEKEEPAVLNNNSKGKTKTKTKTRGKATKASNK